MTLASGREVALIPGPSILPDRVLNAMHRAAIDIYSGPMLDVTADCMTGLRKVFGTQHDTYIFAANGHGAWEASLTNTFSHGEKLLVLESGRFATLWGEMGEALGLEVEVLPCDWQGAVEPQKVEDRLRRDSEGTIAAVLVAQVDTASGVVNDIPAIRRAIDAAGHDALYMVDVVASLATMPFEFDEWGVDVAVGGAQKGLMGPAGLSFNAVSKRGKEKHHSAGLRTPYWDWTARDGKIHYQKYCGTPPEQMLFGLQEAFAMIFEEGLPAMFARHSAVADATRAAIETWQEAGAQFNIDRPECRFNSVSVFRFRDNTALRIREFCEQHCGVTLGGGLGRYEDETIRIGHMGHVNAHTILGCLGAIDVAITSMGLPSSQTGVGAATRVLGEHTHSRLPETMTA
ncbi:MAG: aminotransferase class V-fold PLP-dependent enzyme [Pseudomonadota bacterium]